ncbi:MAG TPA: hypothetical protein VFC17_05485, partial [Candidatus Limnocylindrales bacterium]|nr:hypothetical protein [Candidatus Limnocylindrales bacterium]
MKTIIKIRPWFACAIILAAPDIFSAEGQLVSQIGSSFTSPAGGNGDSGLPVISADGRFVLFASTADNLVLSNNSSVLPRRVNVFLRDRSNDLTTLVSVNLAGTGGGNGDSFPTGISTNGQFALFESSASDLVAADTNTVADIFVRDLVNSTTTLVSANFNGGIGNGVSRGSVMTPDGRYVAFVSASTNLATGDTNNIPDVFIRDLQSDTTTLVSAGAKSTNSTSPFGDGSESPEITPDGRRVVFYSTATNLVPGVTTAGEIYVRELIGGSTTWASASARTLYQLLLGTTNVISYNASISANGQHVAFEVSSNGPVGTSTRGMVLRYNLTSGLTDVVDMNANVPYQSFDTLHTLAMTPDGRFIAFVGNDNGTSGTTTAIYLWDGLSDSVTLVSGDLSGDVPTNSVCDSPAVSADGQWVAFISSATNLTTNILMGDFHAYLCGVQAGVTRLLDADTHGIGVGVSSTTVPTLSADGKVVAFDSPNVLNDNRRQNDDVFASDIAANSTELISAHHAALASQTPDGISGFGAFSVSTNGRFAAFYSDADNLVPNDTNGSRDVFVRDRLLGTNLLVSVDWNGVFSADGVSTEPSISADGRYVVFTSSADNLVSGDTNNARDIFVRDLQSGSTTLVSVSPDGITPGNAESFSPQIGTDGRYVLFHSKASNLAAGSFGTGVENLFLRDLWTGTNYALTTATFGTAAVPASMTPDGSLIAFIGMANGTTGTTLYVWSSSSNRLVYTNRALSSAPISISPDGTRIAYVVFNSSFTLNLLDTGTRRIFQDGTNFTINVPYGTNLVVVSSSSPIKSMRFSGDGNFLVYDGLTNSSSLGIRRVYRYDRLSQSNQVIASGNSSAAVNDVSDSPVISSDGRFIAYRSTTTNIIAQDFNNAADVFIYDVSNHATILVSVNPSGSSTANSFSLQPVFSADSQTLFFQSWSSDLAANDFNHGSDIFALDLTALPVTISGGGGATNSAVFYAQLFSAGSLTQTPTISWPLAAGKNYRVQFKNNLTDPLWQDLSG